MSNAHDYYGPGGYPELHNRGEGRRYIEPDYLAQEADDQLPMISTLGCGPRGHGVYPHIVKSTDGEFYWQLVDDVTGEAVMDSPNLSAGKIEIVQPDRELLEGEAGSFDVRVVRGNNVQSYTVKTPAGSHGSRIYLLGGVMTRRTDETYTCVEADLTVYGGRWSDCPSVRPGDIVVFSLKDSASRYLAFGTVQKACPAQVAFTSRTRFEWRLPYIGGNGNWFVENQDTGVSAQGPQGPAGEFGPLVAKTLPAGSQATARNLSSDPHVLNLEVGIPRGYKATFSAPTAHRLDQSQAPTVEDLDPDPSNAKLDFGIPDGKKAIVKVAPPVTLPAGSNATVGITENASDNSYTIQFGIPEGVAGESIIPRQYCLRAKPPVACKGVFRGLIEVVCYYDDDEDVQKRANCEWTVEAYDSGGGVIEVSWWAQPANACYIDMRSIEESDVIGIQVTATLIDAQQCSVSKTIPVLLPGSAPVDPGGDYN